MDLGIRCTNIETTDLDLIAVGGLPPYTYNWSNGAVSEDLPGVTNGTYSVEVTDSQGCTAMASYEVLPVEELAIDPTITNASCGASVGSISLTITGGEEPYGFVWDNGATGPQIFNLTAGSYSVTVTDVDGCTLEDTYLVEEPAAISLAVNLMDEMCPNAADGSIDLTITGGTTPYTISWSNGASTQDIGGLMAGTYTVNVIDADGCEATETYLINTLSSLSNLATVTDESCFGGTDGEIIVIPTSSALPLSFNWSNAGTTDTVANLAPGNYGLTITDDLGCDYVFAYEIQEPPLFQIDSLLVPNLCFGDSTASIEVIPLGPGNFQDFGVLEIPV